MIATYDTEADLLVIELGDPQSAVDSIDPHPRAIVSIDGDGNALQVEIAAIADGVEEPLRAVATYEFESGPQTDINLLLAAASAAIAVPDQPVNVSFGQHAA